MSPYQIVADESVDYRIVLSLREAGFRVYAIMEENASISDPEVLAIAVAHNALLLTEDKDFGELVFRMQMRHNGILLIRMLTSVTNRPQFVTNLVSEHFPQLVGHFSVLNETILRIKTV